MTPPDAQIPAPVILERTATHRMVWVDVARVIACILIIANHMAFYSAELYRWIWAEFLAARTPFFLLAAGYFVGRGSFGRCLGIAGHPVDAPMWFLRDIIIYTAVAPLLHRMGNYMLWVGIIMLSLNYFALDLADHDYPIANSLGFFLVGMYVSRYSLPFLTESVRRYAVPFLLATLALTWWLVGHRDQHNSMLIALGMLGLMSLAILFTEWFPRAARWVAGLAPACFFIFGTHYIVIILLRESGWITWKGEAWDVLWLCLVPVIFAVLAGLFFCMKRFAPRLVPLLGAYGK